MQLIAEGTLTQKQIAKKIGCSVNAIQQWRAKFKESDGSTPSAPRKAVKRAKGIRRGKKTARRRVETMSAAKPRTGFDEFVRNYWNKNSKAADVLLLPPEIAPQAVQYVNDVLRYAYDQLHG